MGKVSPGMLVVHSNGLHGAEAYKGTSFELVDVRVVGGTTLSENHKWLLA